MQRSLEEVRNPRFGILQKTIGEAEVGSFLLFITQ